MGDALPAIELGAGRTAISIAYGADHVCVVLDNGDMKCFGYDYGSTPGYPYLEARNCVPGCKDLIDFREMPALEFDYGIQ